jgi:hypothetical protein
MTTTHTPNLPAASIPAVECGPDCVYIDGACRCYYGEVVAAQPAPRWMKDIVPTF